MRVLEATRLILLISVAALALATTAAGAGQHTADTNDLIAVVTVTAHTTSCPKGAPPPGWINVRCYWVEGNAFVPGLGGVTYTHGMSTHYDASNPACQHLGIGPVAMTVAGRGVIDFSIAVDPGCSGVPTGFVVTGGTGDFAGASGSGTFVPNIVQSGQWVDADDSYLDDDDIVDDWRTDTWTGPITAPGLVIDLTPPVISGAHSKTVTASRRAKHVRVRFKVKANDAVDGRVPLACTRHSGGFFPIGRTRVRCWAGDNSGNLATAHFTITVKHRR